MVDHDSVFVLPSGTELDVSSALGDLSRARKLLSSVRDGELQDSQDVEGLISDLSHVAELLVLLAGDEEDDRETEIEMLDSLEDAYEGSYYCIAGAGGDLQEWVDGYEKLMEEAEIGKPVKWYRTNGAAVNAYASERGMVAKPNQFQSDLVILLFPLDDLAVGALAIFKLQMQDRWFDDVIDNMV